MAMIDLPNEIIDLICRHLDERASASLSQSHPSLTGIARKYLFRHLVVSRSHGSHILAALLRHPELRENAETVRAIPCPPKSTREEIVDSTASAEHLKRYDEHIKSKVYDHAHAGHFDAILALVLALLPQVNGLDLVFMDEAGYASTDMEFYHVWQVLQRQGAHDLRGPNRLSLNKIQYLTLRGGHHDTFPIEEALYMATSLDQLCHLCVVNGIMEFHPALSDSRLALPQTLTSLELHACMFADTPEDLDTVLQAIPTLKSLILKSHVAIARHGDCGPYSLGQILPETHIILDAVARYQPDLQTLYLSVGDDIDEGDSSGIEPDPTGLARLSQLRTLGILDRCIWLNEGQDLSEVIEIFRSWFPRGLRVLRLFNTEENIDRNTAALKILMADVRLCLPELQLLIMEAEEDNIEIAEADLNGLMQATTRQGIGLVAVSRKRIWTRSKLKDNVRWDFMRPYVSFASSQDLHDGAMDMEIMRI
ncbi:Hypothetical protein D9617_20g027470 [Elsinoe fawcettii]|nr:Hypothetical protein D9617_20g027470 [Elsinoe fawcettii]